MVQGRQASRLVLEIEAGLELKALIALGYREGSTSRLGGDSLEEKVFLKR